MKRGPIEPIACYIQFHPEQKCWPGWIRIRWCAFKIALQSQVRMMIGLGWVIKPASQYAFSALFLPKNQGQ